MKRILSVLLALTMVFSSCVFAAPTPVSSVDTAEETSVVLSEDEAAELMNVSMVKPGINMFTGTTSPLTGENASKEILQSLGKVSGGTELGIADDPTGTNGKVIQWKFNKGKNSRYPTYTFEYGGNLNSLLGHDRIYFSFDALRQAPGYDTAEKYTDYDNFWIMNNNTGGGDVAAGITISASGGWKKMDQLVEMTKSATTEKNPTNFKFEAEVAVDNSVDTYIYFDNLVAIPAYEFKFFSPDGKQIDVKYELFDENRNVITKYAPKAGFYGNYYIPSWSLTRGGNIVEEVELKNENLNFYATSMLPIVSVKAEGELTDIGATQKLTPVVASFASDMNIKPSTAVWTSENESVVTVSTNKDGSAVVTAVGEGETIINLDVSGYTVEYRVAVVLPVTVTGEQLDEDGTAYFEINPKDYKAMVIRLDDATEGDVYAFCYMIDDDEYYFEFEAVADGRRDYYFDLTEMEDWVDGSYIEFFVEYGDATLEFVKLYSDFDPSLKMEFNNEVSLLSKAAQELELDVNIKTSLLGSVAGDYTWTVEDKDDVVSYVVNEDGSLKLRAKVGTGFVKVTATSTEDATLSISRDIYVNVDTTKYGGLYQFMDANTVDDVNLRPCGGSAGNTALSIVNNALFVDRPGTVDGAGGIENLAESNFSVPANLKYMVLKTDAKTSRLKIYYKWDNVAHAEANTAYTTDETAFKVNNDDGTVTHYIYLKNVPETASVINGFMIQIGKQSTSTMDYFYFTSEVPALEEAPAIGYTWDFSTTTFATPAKTEHHFLSTFGNGYAYVTKAFASLSKDGSSTPVAVGYEEVTLDGTKVYKLKSNNNGSIGPYSKPQGMKLEDYPYLWVKYKMPASATVALYLCDSDDAKDGNVANTQWDKADFRFEASEDFTTAVFDLRENGYKASMNAPFSNMMFAFWGQTVLDNVKYNEAGNYYYVVPPLSYKSNLVMTVDEITFASYNPLLDDDETLPLDMAIMLSATDTAITEDSGSVVITPNVYANQMLATKDVFWSVDNGNVSIKENSDGSVTITAISNGEVTITATAAEDPTVKASIKIKVTGQRNKIAAYDFNYLAIGNSYCLHGYHQNYSIWLPADKPTRGMAASEPDLDYFHRVQHYLTTGLNGTMTAQRYASSSLENAGEITDKATTLDQVNANIEADSQYNNIKKYLINNAPNIITVQLSENFSSKVNNVERPDVAENFYDKVYGMIDRYRPDDSVVIAITPFGDGGRVSIIKKYAEKYGFYVADMSDINSYSVIPAKDSPEYNTYIEAVHPVTGEMTKFYRGDEGWKYNPYLAWAQYPAYDIYKTEGSPYKDDRAEFRTHPGDKGMDEIGKRVFEQCEIAVPATLKADYIYVPESIEIVGADAITEQNGTIKFDVEVQLSDAEKDVVWSVDNTMLAEISADGVLTAKHNGTVTVIAKSAYDATVYATKTITITGQALVYTLSYAAGTDDTVTGLPAADAFANGEYTLSTVAPERNGYKFLGWSLTVDGEVIKTISVESDTTVYAVWTLAESWHFDEDDNSEGLILGGFNIVIKNGTVTVLSYDEGVAIGNNSLLLDSDEFDAVNVRINLSGTNNETETMNLTITSTEGTYTYSDIVPGTGSMYEYCFDISDVEGTITGFTLKPGAMECQVEVDWIEFRRIAISEDVKLDKVIVVDEYTVDLGGKTLTVDSLVINEGGKVTFTNGTVVIGALENAGDVVFDCSLIYNGTEAIDGYVYVDVGEKANENNVRYAEVDGVQYAFTGNVYGFLLKDGESKLIQIVEKENANSVLYSTKYLLATSEGVKEIEGLADNTNNVEKVSMRLDEYTGVRFKAYILNEAKSEEVNFKIEEYGFVIGLERDLLNSGEELTLDFHRIATGVAYDAANGVDVVNSVDLEKTVFTGVLYGIPEDSYGVRLVSKTYTKISVEGNTYVVYGEPVVASAYQIAKTLENDTTLSPEHKAVVDMIIDKAENGNDLGFDYGDLL